MKVGVSVIQKTVYKPIQFQHRQARSNTGIAVTNSFRCSLVGTQNAKLIRYCEIIHYTSKDEKLTAYLSLRIAATCE